MGTTTLKPSGGDYTTVAAWVADNGGLTTKNLVSETESVTLEFYKGDYTGIGNGGLNFIEEDITIDTAWTTDATYNITFRCPETEMHNGTPGTGFYWTNTSQNSTLALTGADYTTIENLDLKLDTTVNYRFALDMASASSNGSINRCIFRVDTTSSGGDVTSISTRNTTVRNSLILDESDNHSWMVRILDNNDPVFENNTLATNGSGGCFENQNSASYEVVVTNTVFWGGGKFYDDVTYSPTWNAACGYNASETYTTLAPPGSNNYTSNVVSGDFENTASGTDDFHLSSGSNLIGIANDLSGSFTDDIDGDTRSSWDIGMDEFTSGDAEPLVLYTSPGLSVTNP